MITIRRAVYDQMISHAKAGYPNEACGILSGPPRNADGSLPVRQAGAGVLVAEKADEVSIFYPMKNTDNAAISYFMDPKEQLQVFKSMRQKGLVMRGIFHSHVASEATPSQKDVRLAFYPEASYLIVSLSDLQKPVLRSFRIVEEKVTEEEIKIED